MKNWTGSRQSAEEEAERNVRAKVVQVVASELISPSSGRQAAQLLDRKQHVVFSAEIIVPNGLNLWISRMISQLVRAWASEEEEIQVVVKTGALINAK